MPTIWFREEQGTWSTRPAEGPLAGPVSVTAFDNGGQPEAALLVPPGADVWVNGLRPWGGVHVLQHRDEILLEDRSRFFFSEESIPQPAVYPSDPGGAAVKCVVCRVAFAAGDPVVRCPRCGRTYHQSETKACWTYRDTCGVCGHPTALDGQNTWRPGEDA